VARACFRRIEEFAKAFADSAEGAEALVATAEGTCAWGPSRVSPPVEATLRSVTAEAFGFSSILGMTAATMESGSIEAPLEASFDFSFSSLKQIQAPLLLGAWFLGCPLLFLGPQ
jgi:hypothetical protein